MRTGTHLHSAEPLRERLEQEFGDLTFDQLAVEFQCCAASIERAAETLVQRGAGGAGGGRERRRAGTAAAGARWASEHYLDGGIVNSIPVGRAVELGATRVFVLQVGRVDRPLQPPRKPWEVARVSFEIARRHRFVREMAELPDGVRRTCCRPAARPKDDSPLRLPGHLAGGAAHRGGVRRQQGLPRGAPLMPPRRHAWCSSASVVAPLFIVLTVLMWTTLPLWLLGPARALAVRARAGCGRCGCSGSAWCT